MPAPAVTVEDAPRRQRITVRISEWKVCNKLPSGEASRTFILYKVVISVNNEATWVVWRRYSEFQSLHKQLAIIFQGVMLPPLPTRSFLGFRKALGLSLSNDYVNTRRIGLELYLDSLIKDPMFSESDVVREFLEYRRYEVAMLQRENERLRSSVSTLKSQNTLLSQSNDPEEWIKSTPEYKSLKEQHDALTSKLEELKSEYSKLKYAVERGDENISVQNVNLTSSKSALVLEKQIDERLKLLEKRLASKGTGSVDTDLIDMLQDIRRICSTK